MSDVSEILEDVANGAVEVAKFSPPPFNIIAGIVAAALKAGAAIAHAGKDPVIEITRILDRHPEVAKVRAEWDEYIKRSWPDPPAGRRKTDPPPAPAADDTLPGRDSAPAGTDVEDIYE